MKPTIRVTPWLLALLILPRCAFFESAFELTFGPGQIERIALEVAFPSLDDLTELSSDEMQALPGIPASLDDATLAHLQGALTLTGDCMTELVVEQEEGGDQRVGANFQYRLTTCEGDARCEEVCPEGLTGMLLEASVDAELINEEMANELKDQLSQVSPESIVQIRLQFFELGLIVIGADGEPVSQNHVFEDFLLRFENEAGDGVTVVEEWSLADITSETPQRFDLDSESAFMKTLKAELLAAKPIRVQFVFKMAIPQPYLYELPIGSAGFRVDVQPEFVISVMEAAKSQL